MVTAKEVLTMPPGSRMDQWIEREFFPDVLPRAYSSSLAAAHAILRFMTEHGRSVSLLWIGEAEGWECSWTRNDGRQFTARASDGEAPLAVCRCLLLSIVPTEDANAEAT